MKKTMIIIALLAIVVYGFRTPEDRVAVIFKCGINNDGEADTLYYKAGDVVNLNCVD